MCGISHPPALYPFTQTQNLRLSPLRHVLAPFFSVCYMYTCLQNLFLFLSHKPTLVCVVIFLLYFIVLLLLFSPTLCFFFSTFFFWVSVGNRAQLGSTLEMPFLTSLGVCFHFLSLPFSPLSFSLPVLTKVNVLGPNISSKSSSNLTAVNSSPFHLQFGGLANAVRIFSPSIVPFLDRSNLIR